MKYFPLITAFWTLNMLPYCWKRFIVWKVHFLFLSLKSFGNSWGNSYIPCILINQKVSKYYDHDCVQNFILLFISWLKSPIAKSSHIFLTIYFIFQKKLPRSNLKVCQYKNLDLSGKIEKVLIKQNTFYHFFAT